MANLKGNKKYHFTYKTTNLLNEKYYLGMHSTNDLKDGYLGSGKYLWRSIRKHGKENFKIEILEFLSTREELIKRETEIVNLNEVAKKECMNLKPGGTGGFTKENAKLGRIATDKVLRNKYGDDFRQVINKKFRQSLRDNLEKQLSFNKKLKDGQIKAGVKYDNFKDKTHTKESRLKIGEANSFNQQGDKNSQYGTRWITNGIENKKIKKLDLIPQGWKLGRKLK